MLYAKKPGKAKKVRKGCRSLRTRTFFYYAIGDGERKAFAVEDGVSGYNNQIPDPKKVSYASVFVDGMLQSPDSYRVYPGHLLFLTEQPPPADSRVIAQFVAIRRT